MPCQSLRSKAGMLRRGMRGRTSSYSLLRARLTRTVGVLYGSPIRMCRPSATTCALQLYACWSAQWCASACVDAGFSRGE